MGMETPGEVHSYNCLHNAVPTLGWMARIPNHEIAQTHLGRVPPARRSGGPTRSTLDEIGRIHVDILPYADTRTVRALRRGWSLSERVVGSGSMAVVPLQPR